MPDAARILVVDDDPEVREALREELGAHFRVHLASSGEEALVRLRAGSFDALVSDVRMPGMGGLELVEQARQLDPNLVRVFLTGYADDEVYERASSSGTFKLRKPWGDELELILRHAIEHQQRTRRMRDELNGYVSVAAETPSLRDVVGVEEVLDHLERSLHSLPWVERVLIGRSCSHSDRQSIPGPPAWFESEGPHLVPGSLDRMEQLAWIGAEASTRHQVTVRWVTTGGYARRLVDLALRNAADALRMRELNDEVRSRARQLEAAREEMQERDRLSTLGAMAASVAHDIRSPLAVLLANQEWLEGSLDSGDMDEPELRSILEDNRLATETIHRVLDSLRDFSSEPGASCAVVVKPAIERTVRLLRRQLAEARVTVAVQADDETAALATPGEVGQILLNLISNAVQASPSGSTVHVSVETGDETVTVRVSDEGAGVPEAQADQLFRPFHSTKKDGMGLGLSIAQQMARRHGGDLRLGRAHAARGASFELHLLRALKAI